jgi:GST-like protein
MAVGANLSNDPATLSQEEQDRRARMLYNQRARPVPA